MSLDFGLSSAEFNESRVVEMNKMFILATRQDTGLCSVQVGFFKEFHNSVYHVPFVTSVI